MTLTGLQALTRGRRPAAASSEDPALAAKPREAMADSIRAQQIDLLFQNVGPGVVGAAAAVVVLDFILSRLHAIDSAKGALWFAYIMACMIAHLALLYVYRKSGFDAPQWRRWAKAFVCICFAEGVGWGWAPVGLDESGRIDVQLLITCVTLIVAAASVPAFGSYLPAFFAFFLPTTAPYACAATLSDQEIRHATAYFMPIYMLTVVAMAFQMSRKLEELVKLRLKAIEMAEQLRSQVDLVETALVAKSNFLAAASHDLRQPVHAIALFVGALRELSLPEKGDLLTQQIESSVSALDGQFSALLDISRLDAHSVEVRRSVFGVGVLLNRICQDFAVEAAAKSVELRVAPCRARIRTDPILMERILRNLVSNAVRYTQRGRVLVGCRRRGAEIEMQVWDTGVGIAPEHRELVFKEYFQVNNSERDREKGLGLGLAIVHRLSRLLDCRLSLKSRAGAGSCFSVVAPLAQPHETSPASEAPSAPPSPEKGLIVVIDDEAPIRSGMSALLARWGYDVVVAGSADEAVACLSSHTVCPDLVISDHWLREGETGFDVIDRLRAEYNADIPALLISGDTSAELRAEVGALNVVLLHKPTPNGKLRAAISSLLAASRRDSLTPAT
jgi:signal transduction histidine kinase/CheY-like chemotaxis protein